MNDNTKHTPGQLIERFEVLTVLSRKRLYTDAEVTEFLEIKRRIVACVNACEGISTEVLEGTTAEKLGPHLTGIRPILNVMRQRDELLEHLSYLLHIMNKDKDGSYFICQEAEDAITEAWASVNKVAKN